MKIADKVKIARKVDWEGWTPFMDSWVGENGVIVKECDGGFKVSNLARTESWWFPDSSLEPVSDFDHLKWLEDAIHSGKNIIEIYRAGEGYMIENTGPRDEQRSRYYGATLAEAFESAASGKEYDE